jgi:hypothetical protein
VERRRLCLLYICLEWWFLQSVVTLALTGNTISCRVVWRRRMQVFEWFRMPWAGSLWDIRWLSGRGITLTLCVFPVVTVAVMEKFCDACGDGEYYFRSGCLPSKGTGFFGASIVSDRKSMRHTVAERSWKDADFVCISCI